MDPTDTVILEPDYHEVRAAAARFAAELEACINGDDLDLPSLPSVVLQIRQAISSDDCDLRRLADMAGTDPALAARLMKIACSALFSRGSDAPRNLHAAVIRIGSRMVRNTAVALAAQQVFLGYSSREAHPAIRQVWEHSLLVAAISHLLLSLKRTDISPEDGFLAGLLHEIGTLFILQRSREHPQLWAEEGALNNVIAAWHPRIGAKIAAEWDFPDSIVAAIRDHDTCDLECSFPVTLTNVVATANYLAELTRLDEDSEALIQTLPNFGSLALESDGLGFLLDTARDEVSNLLESLASGEPDQPKTASSA